MNLSNLSVGTKLLLGFGFVTLIAVIASLATIYNLSSMTKIQERVTKLRLPTIQAGTELNNGVNLSLAGLRGYMILGAEPDKAERFKAERQKGWNEIEFASQQLNGFASNWTDAKNVQRLRELKGLVAELDEIQNEIEAIAHTPDNIPANRILFDEAAPVASEVLSSITELIELESTLPASIERKALLKSLADSRGSFAVGLASIRAYLLSGNTQFKTDFQTQWSNNETTFGDIESASSLFGPKQMAAYNRYKTNRALFGALPEKMFTARESEDWNMANYWLGTRAAPRAAKIQSLLEEMRTSQLQLAAVDEDLVAHKSTILYSVLTVSVLVILIFGLAVAMFLSRQISRALHDVVVKAERIASGDLSTKDLNIEGRDELSKLGRSMNKMSESLIGLIRDVANGSAKMASSVSSLTRSAEQTSTGMEDQRREIEQVATAINEAGATIEEIATSAKEAAASADEADQQARQGRNIVEENKVHTHELAENIRQAVEAINILGGNINGVDEIIETISGIAEQTNLLALNAAIEAARAGEQGRGFAVVADEVRTLAARTQESTEQIRSMLNVLKTGSQDAVVAMDIGYKSAEHSVQQVNGAVDALESIAEAVAVINDMNAQIAVASEQQGKAIELINASTHRVDSGAVRTSENALATKRIAGEVGELSHQLDQSAQKFHL